MLGRDHFVCVGVTYFPCGVLLTSRLSNDVQCTSAATLGILLGFICPRRQTRDGLANGETLLAVCVLLHHDTHVQ